MDTASGGHIQVENFTGPGAQKAKKRKKHKTSRKYNLTPGAQRTDKKKNHSEIHKTMMKQRKDKGKQTSITKEERNSDRHK